MRVRVAALALIAAACGGKRREPPPPVAPIPSCVAGHASASAFHGRATPGPGSRSDSCERQAPIAVPRQPVWHAAISAFIAARSG